MTSTSELEQLAEIGEFNLNTTHYHSDTLNTTNYRALVCVHIGGLIVVVLHLFVVVL